MAVFLLCECSASFALAPVKPWPLILTACLFCTSAACLFCTSAAKPRLSSSPFAFIRVKRKFTHDNRIKSKIADYFIFCIENCNFQINILIFFSALS